MLSVPILGSLFISGVIMMQRPLLIRIFFEVIMVNTKA